MIYDGTKSCGCLARENSVKAKACILWFVSLFTKENAINNLYHGEIVMNKYVYIRYDDPEWPRGKRFFITNDDFDSLIEYVATKYYHDSKCVGKAKRLIVQEANTLLNTRRNIDNVDDEELRVYEKASLKQIASLRRPMSGYTTCYAAVIIMAIFNLLADGPEPDISLEVQSLNHDPEQKFLDFCLREQYDDIIEAYQFDEGQFGNIGSHQYMLARYYNATCLSFEQHFHENTYRYITEHLDPQNVLRARNDIPNYRDMNLVK